MTYLELRVQEKKLISKEISKLKDDEELLLVAFGITNPLSIADMTKDWGTNDTAIKAVGRGVTSSSKIRPMDYGGCLTLLKIVHQDKEVYGKVLAEIDLVMPMGLCFDDKNDQLLVGSAFGIFTIKDGCIKTILHHKLFSQVHGISKGKEGFFASCTNTDSIVHFNISENDEVQELWRWVAPDNGYEFDTRGNKRTIYPNKDYSQIDEGGTRTHTTHVNSVLEYSDQAVLATLFHQDELVMIDKINGSTRVILGNMTNLHHIKGTPDGGFIFSAERYKLFR